MLCARWYAQKWGPVESTEPHPYRFFLNALSGDRLLNLRSWRPSPLHPEPVRDLLSWSQTDAEIYAPDTNSR